MNQKKLNKYLAIFAFLSFLIMIFSFIFSNSNSSSQKSKESALLNSKNLEKISKIIIGTKNIQTTLEKKEKFWYAHNDYFDELGNFIKTSSITIADSKIISILLSNSSKIRNLYEISKDEKDFEKLGLSENNTTFIEFSDSSNSFSKIFFGIADSLSKKIALRSSVSENNISYETENNFSQFLTNDLNYWNVGEIFYEVKNPQTIKFISNNQNISINSSDKDFSAISYSFLSIRNGKILERDINLENKIAELEIHNGDGKIFKIQIFKEDTDYFIKKINSLDNSIYEISEWTFEKLKELKKN